MKYLPNGNAIANFSVAVSSGYGDKLKTTWANCQLYGKRAESLQQYLVKGASVAISGEVTLREWESNGKKGQSLDVNVSDLTLMGARNENNTQGNTSTPKAKQNASKSVPADFDDFEDSIPF